MTGAEAPSLKLGLSMMMIRTIAMMICTPSGAEARLAC
jgi:hypothetical protein